MTECGDRKIFYEHCKGCGKKIAVSKTYVGKDDLWAEPGGWMTRDARCITEVGKRPVIYCIDCKPRR